MGRDVAYTSPEACMTVGTGGRPTVPGVDAELPTSPSLSLDRREPLKLPKEMRLSILRARFDSLVSNCPTGSTAGSCMPKARTGPGGWWMPGLTMNEARVDGAAGCMGTE